MPDQSEKIAASSTIEPASPTLTDETEVTATDNPSADGGEPGRPAQPRAQLRATLNSRYNTPRPHTQPLVEANPPSPLKAEPTLPTESPEGLRLRDELHQAARTEAMIARAQLQARQGKLGEARRLLSEVVERDPANSEAWTWLGGLLSEQNPKRARMCLERALELDSTNERARRGLAQLPAPPPLALPAARSGVIDSGETGENQAETVPDTSEAEPLRPDIKIGLEEAVESRRLSGQPADPENIPLGGARIRPAVEKGEMKPPRLIKRRKPLIRLPQPNGFQLSLMVLGAFVLLILVGVAAAVTPVVIQAVTPPTPDPATLPEPTLTPPPLTSDEAFAARLRGEIESYNRFYATARTFRLNVQKGKISWEEYLRNARDLQKDIRNEKKTVDDLAAGATSRLTGYYRELKVVATTTNQAADFTVGGIENTNPEDLEEGNRQFNEAARQLAEMTRKLNVTSPVPTPVPTSTPRPTLTPTAAPSLSPDGTPQLSLENSPGPTPASATTPGLTPVASPSTSPGTNSPTFPTEAVSPAPLTPGFAPTTAPPPTATPNPAPTTP